MLMRVLYYYCCFWLVTRLVASYHGMTHGKPNPDAFFEYDFIRNLALIPGEDRPENDTRKWKPENHQCRVSLELQAGFAIRKRSFSDPETVV